MKEIIVDTLGADNELDLLKGTIESAKLFPDFSFVVYTNLQKYGTFAANLDNIRYIDTEKSIKNNENPMTIIDENSDSSMALSLKDLSKNDNAIALISGGNTGALLVGSIYNVGTIAGIRFPALSALLVTTSLKRVAVVDCGANLDIQPQKAVEFAKLGAALMSSLYDIEKPKVGLLNVGKENKKGNDFAKKTYPLLAESGLDFVGNIEGEDVFDDSVNVVVTDGFSGNILIKNSEVVAQICRRLAIKNGDQQTADEIYKMFGYNDLGGAILLGTKKIVMKAHGAGSARTIISIVEMIEKMHKGNYIEKMHRYFD